MNVYVFLSSLRYSFFLNLNIFLVLLFVIIDIIEYVLYIIFDLVVFAVQVLQIEKIVTDLSIKCKNTFRFTLKSN